MLKDRVIVVTGSSSGIGKSCVEKIIGNGGIAVGFDLQESPMQHENFRHYSVDVRDETGIIRALGDIESHFSRIDALVNCAGVFSSTKSFYEMTSDEWNRVISTNLTGTFLVSKYLSQKMIRYRKGKIINISCIRSRIFRPNMADYAASKAGVVALTSAMALDLSGYNIQVNSVAPGFIDTAMTRKLPEAAKEAILARIPLQRMGSPEEVAEVVEFLATRGGYMTGAVLHVNGGMYGG